MSQTRKRRKRGIFLASVAALSAVGVAAKKAYDYAAAPDGPKDCSWALPSDGGQLLEPVSGTGLRIAFPSSLPFRQRGGTTNDASCLNQTPIYGIVDVRSEEDVRAALQFASENNLHVAMAGQQHSMGGQSFVRQGVVLDMRQLNRIDVDAQKKLLRVQAGATWADVQRKLDPLGLSMRAMQSINIFTVGGTLSVNAHGIAHHPGPIASTVRSLLVMQPDGRVVTASPRENVDLFRHVLGGYGLFGVILEAEIELVDNAFYAREDAVMEYTKFPAYYDDYIDHDDRYGLFYARLSMAPGKSFLRDAATHAFRRLDVPMEELPAMRSSKHDWLLRFVINFSKTGRVGRWLRQTLETRLLPRVQPCMVARSEGLIDPLECAVTRNQAMFDSMPYLRNRLPDTDILQEYFIPHDQFVPFTDRLRDIVTTNGANLLNVTIRIVHRDDVTSLPYATRDMFALVLYFNQRFNEAETATLRKTTTELIDAATDVGGTFYLPYQLYYSDAQLHRAYPEFDAFVGTKKQIDPQELFRNTWYERYRR